MSPALALLLLEPYRHHPFEFLSYTLAELIMLDVVEARYHEVRAHPNDPARIKLAYLERGENFETFEPARYHDLLLKELYERPRFPFNHLAIRICDDLGWKPGRYKYEYLQPALIQGKLLRPHFDWPAHWYLPTKQGYKERRLLRMALRQVGYNFGRWCNQEKGKILEWLQIYGPMILAAPAIPFADLRMLPEIAFNPAEWSDGVEATWQFGIRQLAPPETFVQLDHFVGRWEKDLESALERGGKGVSRISDMDILDLEDWREDFSPW